MTKLELAVKIVCDDIEKDLNGQYKDWNITNWGEMLDAFGQDSKDFKEDVNYLLANYSNKNDVDLFLNDLGELEIDDGSYITYRQLTNAIRKELKKREIFEL